MEPIEIYVLCKCRSMEQAAGFLNEYVPNREPLAEDYPFPEFSDEPECVLNSAEQLIAILEKRMNEPYAFYWQNRDDGAVRQAMIFFTADGGMIVGIVVDDKDRQMWLDRLSDSVTGEYGYVGFDSPPAQSTEEFVTTCESSDQERLIAGDVIQA